MATNAYESITVSNTGIGFTSTLLKDANETRADGVFATLEGAQIRFRLDGTDPTSTEGHIMNVGDTLRLTRAQDVEGFKAIRTGSTDATLKTTYLYGITY